MSRVLSAFLTLLFVSPALAASSSPDTRPNIIVIMGDNIGYGEVSCYDNSRMVETPRIDQLAAQGLRLTNFNVETWCAPSRSAFLTGRYGIRSGTGPMENGPAGMTQWEVTIPELLDKRGYATAIFGKWHLGDRAGRYPTDQGFDEFWGIARSWDDELITARPGFVPNGSDVPFILQGQRGHKVEEQEVLDAQTGQLMDRMLTEKSIEFIRREAAGHKPFFLYVPVAAVHLPIYCDPDFVGKSGAGAIGDAMMAFDYHVGQMVDAVNAAGIADNTIIIVTSDDGAECQDPYRGTSGPWSGCYNTAMEGALRVPFVMRWPGHVPAGRTSNEMVHITDLFTTLVHLGGADVPNDRIIDGVDQLDLFTGKQTTSNRDDIVVFLYGDLAAVKWQDWKMHMFWKPTPTSPKQNVRKLFNLRRDPKEEYDVFWQNEPVNRQMEKIVARFNQSVEREPLIPPRTPDPYRPPKPKQK
ncbi:MAG TPA: arylsulfatase [Candidatus Krumholzibacteria bacterium]|nr:arylsulfatase [Candidatus Krumholzibacteria bacterium]